jgi:hypothetical protein
MPISSLIKEREELIKKEKKHNKKLGVGSSDGIYGLLNNLNIGYYTYLVVGTTLNTVALNFDTTQEKTLIASYNCSSLFGLKFVEYNSTSY